MRFSNLVVPWWVASVVALTTAYLKAWRAEPHGKVLKLFSEGAEHVDQISDLTVRCDLRRADCDIGLKLAERVSHIVGAVRSLDCVTVSTWFARRSSVDFLEKGDPVLPQQHAPLERVEDRLGLEVDEGITPWGVIAFIFGHGPYLTTVESDVDSGRYATLRPYSEEADVRNALHPLGYWRAKGIGQPHDRKSLQILKVPLSIS